MMGFEETPKNDEQQGQPDREEWRGFGGQVSGAAGYLKRSARE